MSSAMQALGIDKLSPDERRELMFEIWDSLAATEVSRPLTEIENQLIDERLAAYRANPQAGSPWDEVKARLLGGQS
jgi:putative addiction module component (TIGR02574 family)